MVQDLSEKPVPLSKLPEWIRVLPRGTVELSDHREPSIVDEASLDFMVDAFGSRGIDLVIDYEVDGGRAPAAGWIKILEARGDGLWARVDWTQQAQDYLEKKEYRYFSLVLRLDPETRRPVALLHVSLTNVPAIKHLALSPDYPPPVDGLLAAGKKLCGMCAAKAKAKGDWHCLNSYWAPLPCPVPDPENGCKGFNKKPSVVRPDQFKKKSLPVPEGVTFFYFGRPKSGSRGHKGVVTMATITPEPGILHLSFSFCSPKDSWCKVTGRDMALARLLYPVVVPYLYSPKRTAREVARAVMTHDFKRLAGLTPGATMWGSVASWTKDLAKRVETRRVSGISGLIPFKIPIPLVPLDILARMMADIAKLGE